MLLTEGSRVRSSAVAEAAYSAFGPIHKTVAIFAAVASIRFTDGQQVGVVSVEQFVVLECVRETLQIFDRRVAASC